MVVIRKVIMPQGDVARIGPAAGAVVEWLVDRGYVPREVADGAGELSAAAARDLPDADQLGELLYWPGEALAAEDVQEYVDWENELAQISRVEPGKLWFRSELGEIGPVKASQAATELARVGWQVSALAFGRTNIGWFVTQIGNVYP